MVLVLQGHDHLDLLVTLQGSKFFGEFSVGKFEVFELFVLELELFLQFRLLLEQLMHLSRFACLEYSDVFFFLFQLVLHLLDSLGQSLNQGLPFLLLRNKLFDWFFLFILVIIESVLDRQNIFVDWHPITEKLFQLIDLPVFCLIFLLQQFQLHFQVMNLVL